LAVRRSPRTTGTPGWVRLGTLLQERRERELDPRWYNRDTFAAERGVNLRLAQEIERNKRENITPVMLRDTIAPGYQVTFESVRAVIDEVPGADLEAVPGSPPRKTRSPRPAATLEPGATRSPAAPPGFISEEMRERAQPFADAIWRDVLTLALKSPRAPDPAGGDQVPDPGGAALFGTGSDDELVWDGAAGRTPVEKTWLIAVLRSRAAAARGREAGTG
jgi:hypothetical protein